MAIAGAKVAFILFGFAQQLLLQWLLGASGYGDVSRVLALVGIVNNVVVAASIQGVSRAVSSAPPGEEPAALAATLRVHAVLAMVISAGFAIAAGLLARATSAPHVAGPLRLVAMVVLLYGLYAPLVGSLNGRRRFLAQAGLDVSYSLVRTVGMCGGAFVMKKSGGDAVVGACVGFAVAALIITPIAARIAGLGKRGPSGPTARDYLASLGSIALGQVFLNLLMQTDLMVLSHYAGALADEAGLPAARASELVGIYRGAQLFAFLPYQLLISISFVLFPMLARAIADGDREAVATFTATGVRLGLVMTGLFCAPIAGLAPHVLRILPLADASTVGGPALRILALGMGAFAIFGIVCSALTSLRRERITALLTAVAVALVASACIITIPQGGFGPTMLVASATATSVALTLSSIVGSVVLVRTAGAFAPAVTIARVLAAIGITVVVASRLPWLGKPGVLIEAALMAALYVVVLVATGELGKRDLATVRGVLLKKRAA
jgi:stage V sporulation protein B